jgi:AbrB family looped-hinge helix DNA binding protein
MPKATITSKGQVTIPKEVRELLGLHPGDKLVFLPREDGTVRIVPATTDLRALRGRLSPRKRGVSVEAMREAARRGGTRG